MSRRYSIEDLLTLRASPLIFKPPGLPPSEEWMGPQEQTSKRPATRGRQDESLVQAEGSQKRAGYEPSQRRQATDPERIVLGPPRRSFASSTGRPFTKHGGQDSEDSTRDKHHERTKTGEEHDYKLGDRRGFGGQLSRFGNRQEQDGTYGDRPRRRNDEEGDGRHHRVHDRSEWGSKDSRDEAAFDDDNADSGHLKFGLRRDQGRGRFEQPWFRGEKGPEDSRREKERGSGWRNNKSRDGDWDLPNKGDVDPEWMDTVDVADSTQARTQEDFQKWKERMKAGNTTGAQKAEQAAPSSTLDLPSETQSAFGAPSSSILSPDPSGNSMDKFFARFSEKKPSTEEQVTSKPVAKTRFASLFGPSTEAKVETPPPQTPNIPVEVSAVASPPPALAQVAGHADADQAGFQRILQMLGKKETAAAPQPDGQKSKPVGLSNAHSHQRHASPDLVALFKQDASARQTPVSQTPAAPPGLERLANSKSPAESQTRQSSTPNKDELLLNLLRQAEISTKPQPQQPYMDNRGTLGQFGASDQHRVENRSAADYERLQMHDRSGGRSMFDDPAISSMSYSGETRLRDGQQRSHPNGAPPGFEDAYMDAQRANGSQSKPMHNMPPGLQRPPGLEQMTRMPPGWNQQQGAQGQPPQNRTGPPPGLSRGMAPFGNQQPPPPPMPQQHPGQSTVRPPQQRPYAGDSNISSFPPGMGPPPGFATHGPPPGFPHSNAAQSAQHYGRFAMGGNEPGSQPQGPPPPNMGRGFMEMYGNDRSGMRGGNGVSLPPGFR